MEKWKVSESNTCGRHTRPWWAKPLPAPATGEGQGWGNHLAKEVSLDSHFVNRNSEKFKKTTYKTRFVSRFLQIVSFLFTELCIFVGNYNH